MKLVTKKRVTLEFAEATPDVTTKKEKTKKEDKKPNQKWENLSDEYKDLLPPSEIPLDDKGNKLVVTVTFGGEYGLPRVGIRLYVNTPVYTGFTKKGITFDLDKLPYLKAVLCDTIDDADEKKLFDYFKD